MYSKSAEILQNERFYMIVASLSRCMTWLATEDQLITICPDYVIKKKDFRIRYFM
jgi:hypothetical protein